MKKVFDGAVAIMAAFVLLTALPGATMLDMPDTATMEQAASPAFVLNSGRDGATCTLSGVFNGTGHATLVVTNPGRVNFTCNGVVLEPAPDRAIVSTASGPFGTSCKLVVTPSGNFSTNCH
jgi:hypothetical protein